jgi:hypothetical protein
LTDPSVPQKLLGDAEYERVVGELNRDLPEGEKVLEE